MAVGEHPARFAAVPSVTDALTDLLHLHGPVAVAVTDAAPAGAIMEAIPDTGLLHGTVPVARTVAVPTGAITQAVPVAALGPLAHLFTGRSGRDGV